LQEKKGNKFSWSFKGEVVALFHTKAKMLAGGASFVDFQQQTRKTQASSDFITSLNFIYATTSREIDEIFYKS
jgi:hypothetical protein